MRVLVVGTGPDADKIAEGARQAGALVERSGEWREGFDLSFVDSAHANASITGQVAVFHSHGLFDSKGVSNAIPKLTNARLVNQISLEKKGLLKNKLEEIDFERARAFGERTVRNASGEKFHKHSGKEKIRGYKK